MEVYGTAVQNWVCEFASGIKSGEEPQKCCNSSLASQRKRNERDDDLGTTLSTGKGGS